MKNEMLANNTKEISKWQLSSKTGLVLAILFILIGLIGIVQEYKREPFGQEMKERIMQKQMMQAGYDPILGIINSLTYWKDIDETEVFYAVDEMTKVVPILCIGICLLVRSFKPGISAGRIALTILGGFIVGFCFAPIIGVQISVGLGAKALGGVIGLLTCSIPGIILVRYGLKPKKTGNRKQLKQMNSFLKRQIKP